MNFIPKNGFVALFKQGCNEIPEIIGSTGLALVGICMAVIGCHNYNKYDGENRRYKQRYVIMRPDDPKVAKIHKD